MLNEKKKTKDKKIKFNPDVKLLQKDNKEVDKAIGTKLREIRKKLGLSQTELVNKLKSKEFIQTSDLLLDLQKFEFEEYESGRETIPCSLLYEISKVLGVSLDWFF